MESIFFVLIGAVLALWLVAKFLPVPYLKERRRLKRLQYQFEREIAERRKQREAIEGSPKTVKDLLRGEFLDFVAACETEKVDSTQQQEDADNGAKE